MAATSGTPVAAYAKKALTECPANVREAVDWILRVRGKDGRGADGTTDEKAIKGLAGAAAEQLSCVEPYVQGEDRDVFTSVLDALRENEGANGLIAKLSKKLAGFVGYTNSPPGGKWALGTSKGIGKNDRTGNDTYKTVYGDSSWNPAANKVTTCAKIFLGIIPLLFSGLSYLYWQCNKGKTPKTNDRWANQQINEENDTICTSLQSMGYIISQLDDKGGTKVAGTDVAGLLVVFKQFGECTSVSNSSNNDTTVVQGSFAEFVEYLHDNDVKKKTGQGHDVKRHPLACLYIAAETYFQVIEQRDTKLHETDKRLPSSIREMLYWLMVLPYTPVYWQLERRIEEACTNSSGTVTVEFYKGANDHFHLESHSVNYYLRVPCYYAGFVLMAIQGGITGDTDTTHRNTPSDAVIIYDIYCNTTFNFLYPSSVSECYKVLSDVVFALYFQCYFLQERCRTCPYKACGRAWCTYGKGVSCYNVASWKCTITDTADKPGAGEPLHDTATGNCLHWKNHISKCGKGVPTSNPSPLQVFLTDELGGLKCVNEEPQHVKTKPVNRNSPYHEHTDHLTRSQWCHIPMGFDESNFITSRHGRHLYLVLWYYTDASVTHSSLCQLAWCVFCVKLHTPRTTGDLFAFFYFIADKYNVSVRDKVAGAKQMKDVLIGAIDGYPGYHISESTSDGRVLTNRFQELHSGDHPRNGSKHESLQSLYFCGEFAEPYLSWIIYLTEDLKTGLEQLLTEFRSIDCSKNGGCKHTKGPKCTTDCHNDKSHCQCDTIVQCAGALYVFYRFGFTFENVHALNGTAKEENPGTGIKKYQHQCSDFSTQLRTVLDSDLFSKLLEAIYTFLKNIRLPFVLYLLTFWLVVVAYLSYGLTIPLDLLYIRSHWRLARSHKVTPLFLLSQKLLPSMIDYLNHETPGCSKVLRISTRH
ncbi:uncharacterized protein BXIN_0134 [Babesia sp. Xinjiang]|uniref:uncharacterized protein n=1 Tax=Babesia sp. Xinjiang TaxID=462227 RepID=UPI000A2160DF|nr:uncharacterized protein BXIN_0134 [Babesia sp. Xinjiang]ORM39722.1 hypothetical protein BXIN_0134 [Babesia sp. Xinjiang]